MDADGIAISVVITTVGRAVQLEASLGAYEHLVPETPPFEVVLVLDGEDAASRTVSE